MFTVKEMTNAILRRKLLFKEEVVSSETPSKEFILREPLHVRLNSVLHEDDDVTELSAEFRIVCPNCSCGITGALSARNHIIRPIRTMKYDP